ncbi:IclR family transcriptional regulator [Caulobacter segnis]|uniref:IclR family transcriptional regulator n=1 Tax=Caulobacter segnis TaxID=88688 RepID=UPI00240F8571|nr:IclR family transcriptional regulator [Caulobacter segnis]MDG2522563.1 IclR family transcriptional regulator [Caulobacter segnis]
MDTSVARAFSILEAVARAPAPVRLSDLAHDLALQKSTVHRILKTLSALGYVDQEAVTDRYRPTLKAWEVGMVAVRNHPVRRAAAPFLTDLQTATGETVSLTVLSGDDVLYLDKIVSPRPMKFSTQPGSRIPAPLAAGGQAILAHEPEAAAIVRRVAARLLNRRDFDSDAFLRQLLVIRERGYTLSRPEPDVVAVAAPIMGRDGRAAGALTVSGPASRLGETEQQAAIEALLLACARLAETVGQI